ncbi:hypothetical protein ACKKBG_A04305 [Auxenochlorella protothecoides x Auxenochlorella symbiontica]
MGRQRPDTRARVSKACKFLGICMVILIGPVLAVSSQRNALLLLAASIDTTGVLNWSVNTAMCSWTGVTCNAAGSVTTVDLDGLGLMGQLPVDENLWQELDTITNLNLANNDLSGLVPAQISQLTSLHYLSLAGNRLTGSLPSTWSSLKDLVGLDVSHNRISGTLPSTWGDLIALKALDLSSNSLSGGIPYSWTALNLNALSLAGNSGLCASGAVFSPKPDVYYASCLDSSPTLPGINPTYISPPPQPMASPPPVVFPPPPSPTLSPGQPSPPASPPPPWTQPPRVPIPKPVNPPSPPSPPPSPPTKASPPPPPQRASPPPHRPPPPPASPATAPEPSPAVPEPSPAVPSPSVAPAPAPSTERSPPPPPSHPPPPPARPTTYSSVTLQVTGASVESFNTNTSMVTGVKAIWSGLASVPEDWTEVAASSQARASAGRRLMADMPIYLLSTIFTEDPSAASASISAASANGTLAAELAALGLTLVNGTVVVLNSVDSSSTSSKGALIGGIVGGVLGAVLLVAGGFFAWRWHRSRSQAGAGGAAFSSKNAAFEESEGVEKVAGPAGVAGAVYDVPGTSKAEGEFANPMYGGAEEGAKPANPVYDSGDSPLAPAAGGYPGAAGTAGPSDFTNTAFGEGLDTPKGDTVPSNPLFDTSTSQLSGPGGKAEYDDTKEAPVAAVADFSNPAFADAGMLDTPKGDDGAGPGANPLFDSQTSQLSGPEEGQNYAAGDKPGSRPKAQTPQAWPPANPLFGSDAAKEETGSNPTFEG